MHETPGAPLYTRPGSGSGERSDDSDERGEAGSGLSIEELARAASLSVRTIRYYIAEGLLPGPGARGKQATYGEGQLVRLQLIRRLAARHVPLAQMRKLLGPLRLEDVRSLLAEEEQRAAELQRAEQAASPQQYVAGLLARARAIREAPLPSEVYAQPSAPAQYVAPWSAAGATSPRSASAQIGEAQRKPSSGPYFRQSPSSEPNVVLQPAEAWQRWELAPGVELQVRADAARRQRELIRRVLEAARDAQVASGEDGEHDRSGER